MIQLLVQAFGLGAASAIGGALLAVTQQTAAAASAAHAAGLASGLVRGAVSGVATGVTAANPSLAVRAVALRFRIINAPFWYLGGSHRLSQEVKTIRLAQQHLAETQAAFVDAIKDSKLTFDGIKVCLDDQYVNTIRETLTTLGGNARLTNPATPSLFSRGCFEDPFGEIYYCYVLSERGQQLVLTIVFIAGLIVILVFLVKGIRYTIRYGLRSTDYLGRVVREEKERENRKKYFSGSINVEPLPPPSNYLRS